MEGYKAVLMAAMEVHRFNRDVDETNQRIGEKAALLGGNDSGGIRDLTGVERLLRAQDQVERLESFNLFKKCQMFRDMSAIHRKLNEHDEQAKQLLQRDPPLQETVNNLIYVLFEFLIFQILDSLRKLELSWQRLAELAHARRQSLQQCQSLQRFLDALRRMEQWAQGMRTKMGGQAKARNVEEAERALQRHAERKAEIGARDEELRVGREMIVKLLKTIQGSARIWTKAGTRAARAQGRPAKGTTPPSGIGTPDQTKLGTGTAKSGEDAPTAEDVGPAGAD